MEGYTDSRRDRMTTCEHELMTRAVGEVLMVE